MTTAPTAAKRIPKHLAQPRTVRKVWKRLYPHYDGEPGLSTRGSQLKDGRYVSVGVVNSKKRITMAGIVCHRNHQVRFTKHDGIALCLAILIPLTAILLTMVSVLPSLGASPLPDFANPIEGFEPRGTKLSDRIVTLYNFDRDHTILLRLPEAPARSTRKSSTRRD
ncbi:hypothetical protein OS493_039811 [Desmophyllum pertusum]|uniref:Uncharacterized protein n=1 Tax=Desmophyllum pertusum TaxID=174260 RepID=A0A9W9Z5Z9_9CNID|nr:hypothetical protein OS493_039811 [Desmophyllum pertusum]